ncbi:MAG TPA: twin-arginine translocase TatA/TatE family subunit [Acidimicrobiales bacterium]|nr:twin-arginine translocase TatA/TatE family subunit [Acidimicrobiales bacterium]
MGAIGTGELVIILLIVLVFFGGAKLPGLARSLGQAQREFRKGNVEGLEDETTDDKPVT